MTLDLASWQARVGGETVDKNKKEFDTLKYLMEHEGKAVTRDQLMNEVWGYDYMGETNVVDVYIRYLRQKIDEACDVKTLHTVRGVGYVMKAEDSHV